MNKKRFFSKFPLLVVGLLFGLIYLIMRYIEPAVKVKGSNYTKKELINELYAIQLNSIAKEQKKVEQLYLDKNYDAIPLWVREWVAKIMLTGNYNSELDALNYMYNYQRATLALNQIVRQIKDMPYKWKGALTSLKDVYNASEVYNYITTKL